VIDELLLLLLLMMMMISVSERAVSHSREGDWTDEREGGREREREIWSSLPPSQAFSLPSCCSGVIRVPLANTSPPPSICPLFVQKLVYEIFEPKSDYKLESL